MDLAKPWRLADSRDTGKHSPEEPNTINRPRRPDAVGPKMHNSGLNSKNNIQLIFKNIKKDFYQ